MKTDTKENISAMIDDHTTLEDLAVNPETLDAWSKYHLIGNALRQELPERMNLQLSAKICDAIAQEPVPQPQKEENRLSSFWTKIQHWCRTHIALKHLHFPVQAAMAAAVAVFVVQLGTQPHTDHPLIVPPTQTQPFVSGINPVSLQNKRITDSSMSQFSPENTDEKLIEQRQQMIEKVDFYLQDYQNQLNLYPHDWSIEEHSTK